VEAYLELFFKRIIIDCRGHLLGRLASIIAKELLQGQRIVCVRTEALEVSGSFARNKVKYLAFLRKKCNVNPRRGPFHFRAPSKILWRTVRGMLPHKTVRGEHALKRFKAFEGIPAPYDMHKRMVVPEALRVLRLRPGRNYTVVGELSKEFGWKYSGVIAKLEKKRKVRAAAWFSRRKALKSLHRKAEVTVKPKTKKHKAISKYLAKAHFGAFA